MPSGKGNPQIQIRLPNEKMEKVDVRARELGFVTPSGKVNRAGYAAFLINQDLSNYGQVEGNKVK